MTLVHGQEISSRRLAHVLSSENDEANRSLAPFAKLLVEGSRSTRAMQDRLMTDGGIQKVERYNTEIHRDRATQVARCFKQRVDTSEGS
eukprot:5979613-Pleurochrysis_carterae.AAC.1